jgi:hypothetical protein
MSLFGWLRRLFQHTAETPPRIPPGFAPAGLERPDPPELLIPEDPPGSSAFVATMPVSSAMAPEAAPTQRHVTAHRITTRDIEVPDIEVNQADHGSLRTPSKGTDGFGEALGEDVYGITLMIEYVAADSTVSRRRIMLRSVSVRNGHEIYLRAFCFERSAPRTFRIDRVRAFIDVDGVVHDDPIAFLRDELRLTLPRVAPADRLGSLAALGGTGATDNGGDEKPGVAQRRVARDGLRVLCALARSDGLLHSAEVDAVLDYIETVCQAEGVPFTARDRAALEAYVRRQRPGLDVLESCLHRFEVGPPVARALLLDHAQRLVMADGKEHESEAQLLAKLRRDS